MEVRPKAEALARERAAWPCVSVLQRFALPLQRLTTHLVVSKKWFPRFFVMENRRLYYSDGDNGHPDSQEGTLSFVRCNPAPDGRYCVDLAGTRTDCSSSNCTVCGHRAVYNDFDAQAAASPPASARSMGRSSRSRSSSFDALM